jgi:hypothetical protein
MAIDFFVVPTATFRMLFVLVILAHDRRRIVQVAVTDHPTAAWTAQQLRNAFPDHNAPAYLLHDRDAVFAGVATTIAGMNIQAIRTAPRSPWQNAYVERVIGSIRRECLDHVIVANEAGLQRVLRDYVAYYMNSRTHLALDKDPPISRSIAPASAGCVVATPQVGGLHHRYDRGRRIVGQSRSSRPPCQQCRRARRTVGPLEPLHAGFFSAPHVASCDGATGVQTGADPLDRLSGSHSPSCSRSTRFSSWR